MNAHGRGPLSMALSLAACLGLVASSSAAKEPETQDAAARGYSEAGMKHYDLAEYDEAIAALKQAYEISPVPALLFNLAQAARKAKRWEMARDFYESYLRQLPAARNRADVEKFIREVQQSLRVEAPAPPEAVALTVVAAPPPPPAVTPTIVEPGPVAPPPPPVVTLRVVDAAPATHPGRTAELVGAALFAVGVGLLGAGGYLAGHSESDAQTLHQLALTGGAWSDHYQSIFNDGRSSADGATALFAVGGVAAAAGVLVAILGLHQRSVARRIAVAPLAQGGAAIRWQGTF